MAAFKRFHPRARLKVAVVLAAISLPFANCSRAQQPVVAIHDSELTRALESIPASGLTPAGAGTTGFQWWPTNWHYFVMPDSAKEMLQSDGTAFTVVTDSNISAGNLLNSNGTPAYPIVISLASEAIRDDEIARLTNYVAAGGFLLVGSSSFTRNPDGTTRGDFAIASQMGIHMVAAGLTNWAANSTFTVTANHRLTSHIPQGTLNWQMPQSADEISWPEADHVPYPPSGLFHLIWQVQPGGATVLAQADSLPYLLVMPYGKGWFIYDAAMQPLLGHGGWAPGMYAYGIVRNAIEWAFQSQNMPVVRLSPWPYAYDAAVVFRHDMEADPAFINSIEPSAQYESARGASGDYFFCTGELREDMTGVAATLAGLQNAVTNYHATIASHNGGMTNLNLYSPPLATNSYDFWHWGPDEMLDLNPPGYSNGQAYATASISNSFSDVQGWGLANPGGIRLWVAPYFNATREGSLEIQEQLGVQITGDEKLGPFPHWVLSTQTADKLYDFISLPVSDWYLGSQIGQAMEDGHTTNTVHALVDFYYGLGALVNLYSHSSADGTGPAGGVASEYLNYSLSKPRMWSANAIGIYNWWLNRRNVQVLPSFAAVASQSSVTLSISGATDSNTAVQILVPNAAFYGLQVKTNGVTAGTNAYRINGALIKLLTGAKVTNIVVSYSLPPVARNNSYLTQLGTSLTVPAPGVLSNATASSTGGSLAATLSGGPTQGTLHLNTNGMFTYTPGNMFVGVDQFNYLAGDGHTNSGPAAVTLMVNPPGDLFSDNFVRSAGSGSVAPWVPQMGTWQITNGALAGASVSNSYGYAFYADDSWTDYSVQGEVRFSSTNAWGGGIGGRVNPATGSHYAAWIYPEGSIGGSNVLKLIKFEGWTTWSHSAMGQASLSGVGALPHTLRLDFQGSNITVFFDGIQQINVTDNNFDLVAPFTNGGIIADLFTYPAGEGMTVRNMTAGSSNAPPMIQSILATNGAAVISWSAVSARSYSLQWNTNLGAGWNEVLPGVFATATTAAATNVPGNSARRYFRVSLQP